MVLDLSNVPLLGVTSSLALENAIAEASDRGCQIYIVGAKGKVKERLENLGVNRFVPAENMSMSRQEALEAASNWLDLQGTLTPKTALS